MAASAEHPRPGRAVALDTLYIAQTVIASNALRLEYADRDHMAATARRIALAISLFTRNSPVAANAILGYADRANIDRAIKWYVRDTDRTERTRQRVLRGRLVARCKTPHATASAAAREQQEEHSYLRVLSTDLFRAMLLNGYLTLRCRLCEQWRHCKPLFCETRVQQRSGNEVVCGECTARSVDAKCARCSAAIFSLDRMFLAAELISHIARGAGGSEWLFYCADPYCVETSDTDSGGGDGDDSSDSGSGDAPMCDMCGNQCDADDGWHVRDRPLSPDVYCDDCFQRSPYQVCFRCDKWVDTEQDAMHSIDEERRCQLLICDECELKRLAAIAAKKK